VRGGSFRPHYDLIGDNAAKQGEFIHGLLAWSHAATLGQRWRGLIRLVRGLWRMRRKTGSQ